MTTPETIECELRAFVADDEHARLLERLRSDGAYAGEDDQETWYFEGNGDPDLRIQRNTKGSKIWYKDGKMHAEARREIEVPCRSADDFGNLEALFTALGYRVAIKWFRRRHAFTLGDISIALDDTRGYGKVVEFEKLCLPHEREAALKGLTAKMAEYGIAPSPKEEFERRYAAYKKDWRALTGEA